MKPGYKQTDVGVIPEEWEILQIRDVCRLVNGRGFKPHEWQTSGLPIIRIQNLNGSDDFNFYSGQYHPKILIEHGQLLFAWSGSRGTSFGPHVWNGGRALLNYHTWKVVVNESNVTPDFLLYALRQLTSYIENMAHGASALVHTQKWQMEKLPIVVPASHPEQHAIATALSDMDALLASLDRLIAKKRDLKQAAMQQLLTGQTRLPGFHDEWEVKLLPEVCQFRGGKAHEQHITEFGQFVCVNSKFISSDGNVRKYSTANFCRARRDDILMVMSDLPNGRALAKAYLVEQDDLYAVNQRVCALTAYRDSPQFLYYILNRNPYFLKFDDGVSQTHLLNNVFMNCPITISPTVSEQTAIAGGLGDMDAELVALEQRRDKTRALKQAMMQELLTGRTRLL